MHSILGRRSFSHTFQHQWCYEIIRTWNVLIHLQGFIQRHGQKRAWVDTQQTVTDEARQRVFFLPVNFAFNVLWYSTPWTATPFSNDLLRIMLFAESVNDCLLYHCQVSSVPHYCDFKENTSQKYIWVSELRTWTGAQSYCREKYTDLASVRNETEHRQILVITRYYYGYNVWIGLYRNRLWSDQANSSFTCRLPSTQSVAAEPDNGANVPGAQHCAAVSLQYFGQLTDESCFDRLPNNKDHNVKQS